MNTPKVTPKDFFLWAGAMIALYGSVISFITLIFEYINYAYPDPLAYYSSDPYSGSIRFAMASLIVLVPVALILLRIIRKEIEIDQIKEQLWVRRWALVLTVFVAGAAIVGDLITLINYFLGGDITMRFILKVLVLLLVAGGVFLHFLADLRGYWTKNTGKAQLVGYAAGIVVIAAIASGFLIMGSPAQVRLYRFDSQKVSDLQNIQWQIVNYWQQKQTLPNTLNDIEDPISGYMIPLDPQSNASYVYKKTGDMTFQLCATFNADSMNANNPAIKDPSYAYPVGFPENENWTHGAGEVCFDRTIDPERYPPYEKRAPIPAM